MADLQKLPSTSSIAAAWEFVPIVIGIVSPVMLLIKGTKYSRDYKTSLRTGSVAKCTGGKSDRSSRKLMIGSDIMLRIWLSALVAAMTLLVVVFKLLN